MTRIVFNGQEYSSREAMPEEVRRGYDEALAMLREAHPGAVEGALEPGGDNKVVSVQREVSFKFGGAGDGAPPEQVRRILEAMGGLGSGGGGSETHELEARASPDPLHTPMAMFLAFVAGFVLVFGVALMLAIGGGRDNLKGRLAVAVAALFLLGWLDTTATRLARRRESLLGPDSPGYRRFVVWSSAGLATAAVLLLGLAWYMP